MPTYKMGLFYIKMPTNMTVDGLSSKIEKLTVTDDRFVDLHRCHQTLLCAHRSFKDTDMNEACKRYGKKLFNKTSYATYRPKHKKEDLQRERQESHF